MSRYNEDTVAQQLGTQTTDTCHATTRTLSYSNMEHKRQTHVTLQRGHCHITTWNTNDRHTSRYNKDTVVEQHGTQTRDACHATTRTLSYSNMEHKQHTHVTLQQGHMSHSNQDKQTIELLLLPFLCV